MRLFLLSSVLILGSCMSSTVFKATKSADLDIPNEINSFSLIKRDKVGEVFTFFALLDWIRLNKSPNINDYALDRLNRGLTSQFNRWPRFTVKQTQFDEGSYGYGWLKMKKPLDWHIVEEICEKNKSNALIVIEGFNTSTSRKVIARSNSEDEGDGKPIDGVFDSDLSITVTVDWRIYYPVERKIIDFYIGQKNSSFKSEGSTARRARRNLPEVDPIIEEMAYELGMQFGGRLFPSKVTLKRTYYSFGSSELKLASENMKKQEYEKAIKNLLASFNLSYNQTLQGKLAYNLAVAHEAMGDFEKAIYWVNRAIENRNKKADKYLRLLQNSVKDNNKAKKQMGYKSN